MKGKAGLNQEEEEKVRNEPATARLLKDLASSQLEDISHDHRGPLRKILKKLNQIEALQNKGDLSPEELDKVVKEQETFAELKEILRKT